jgi:hypothetical protein
MVIAKMKAGLLS